jgi:protein-S-isoprenylcysteine O-methyltransferase Ste14
MTRTPQNKVPADVTPDVPKLGLIRPPLVYLASLAIGTLMQLTLPLPVLSRTFNVALGVSLVAIAIALCVYSVTRFRAAGTPVPARKPTTVIVRHGPYRFSRNPIYLAFSLFQLGVAIWINSLWLLATLVAAVALIHFIVIPIEEQYLERKFGAEYLDYMAAVRRWL